MYWHSEASKLPPPPTPAEIAEAEHQRAEKHRQEHEEWRRRDEERRWGGPRVGDSEPALVGPWTMGRDKKNPKPLDAYAFSTLVKTAREVLLQHQQSARAQLHKSRTITDDRERRVRVDLDIVPDEDDPHAILAAFDEATVELIASCRVGPTVKLTEASAQRFVRTGEA